MGIKTLSNAGMPQIPKSWQRASRQGENHDCPSCKLSPYSPYCLPHVCIIILTEGRQSVNHSWTSREEGRMLCNCISAMFKSKEWIFGLFDMMMMMMMMTLLLLLLLFLVMMMTLLLLLLLLIMTRRRRRKRRGESLTAKIR